MGHQRNVIDERQASPWVGIAREDAKEWWRDHPGASFSEFAEWIERRYIPATFMGMGLRVDRALTPIELESVDDVYVGLADAANAEHRRRDWRWNVA